MRRSALPFVIALLLCACGQKGQVQDNAAEAADVAGMPTKGVDRGQKGQSAPAATFLNPGGEEISLADFKGTPVLVNLWATWCAPCVKELPTLDALAREHGKDGGIEVIAISQDMGPQGSVEAFLSKLKTDELGAYHDPKMALSGALNAQVLPTTILYNAEGKEVWRYVGDLDWTGEEARKLLAEVRVAGKG